MEIPTSSEAAFVQAGYLHRKDFGKDFLFGSSTSACQIEGGLRRDGRGPSTFDTFAKKRDVYAPYGEDAVNHREYYKEDVKLMKAIGFNAYRFSISWSRIMPTGKADIVNQEGIEFYRDLLKNLKDAGIEPMVTLMHFDPPQALEDSYNTFLRDDIVADFCAYADLCFREFGDYVKLWVTMNEPWSVAYGGYVNGGFAPGYVTMKNSAYNSSMAPPLRSCSGQCSSAAETPKNITSLPPREKWPYIAAHNEILAHAHAARLYKEKYQKSQGGKIGLNLVTRWYLPLVDNQENREAVQRALDFMFGWFMDPLFRGEYPKNMHENVTETSLPEFGANKDIVKGSYDFVSLNYYTTQYVTNEETGGGDYVLDQRVQFHEENSNGEVLGTVQGAGGWVHGYPKGLLELLLYIKNNYSDPEIYITENGIDDLDDDSMALWDSLHDRRRTTYIHDHISYVKEALRRGVKVKGHFVWSFLDDLELGVPGYGYRLGIVYVDYYDKNRKRLPKSTAYWYKSFLAN